MVFNNIWRFFRGSEKSAADDAGLYIYVKCGKCGAPVRIRADKEHDLQQDYDGDGFIYRKEVMDSRCYKLFHFTLTFDGAYNIIEREIEGGEFITEEEYQALTTTSEEASP